MRAVDESVERTLCYDRIGEQGVPVFGRAVGCDYDGAIAIAPVNKLVEILSLEDAQLFQGEIVFLC